MPPMRERGDPGALAENIMHFARVLRAAGVPIGPATVVDAVDAMRFGAIRSREDFYWALHAFFVRKREHHVLFDEAFRLFWRNPQVLERMLDTMLPTIEMPEDARKQDSARRRVAEAFLHGLDRKYDDLPPPKVELDATYAASDEEVLKTRDFEQMSADELDRAKDAIARLRLPLHEVRTRRTRAARTGPAVDLRASLRAAMRTGGDVLALKKRRQVVRHPPLVVLCDVSGSMSRYARMVLHFLHAVTGARDRVHVFTFGTRLTNITRALARRDVDDALAEVAKEVKDWSGGTRIGEALHAFNRDWSRRVLGQGAVVLLITDGLDRDAGRGLELEVERLHMSCRRLVWLNPLLRWDGFEPKALGVRAILPHVDEFRPVHNIESLEALAAALSDPRVAERGRRLAA